MFLSHISDFLIINLTFYLNFYILFHVFDFLSYDISRSLVTCWSLTEILFLHHTVNMFLYEASALRCKQTVYQLVSSQSPVQIH